MIEYLHDAIRASTDADIIVNARIRTSQGADVSEGCRFIVEDDFKELFAIDGEYADGVWTFIIPAETISGMRGRYWYHIKDNYGNAYSFSQPLYFR